MNYLKKIFLLCAVLLTFESYGACCAQRTRTITKRKVRCTPTTTIRNRYVRYPSSRSYGKSSSSTKYYASGNTTRSNHRSALQSANRTNLKKLKKIHDMQLKLLVKKNIFTADETEKIRKQILTISRPMRTMLGRSQDFPYFSEITTLDEVALSLVGKKSPYSEKDTTAFEILRNIQKKQYEVFAASLPND